ncbi:MAG TPA: FxsA family protein [Sporichthyaceae bacterium]|jgi:UPF0716 protein FxsA|nr:FxsA family protein [Sporichthyaceae bacterium]
MPGLILALLLVPIAEIYVIVKVGETIGAGPTILLLIADGVIGAWLIRHEGRRAWQALMQTLAAGRMPTRELADGALVLIGGTLLIAPGFLTDIVGYLLVLPFTRPLVRGSVVRWAASRVQIVGPPGARGGPQPGKRESGRPKPGGRVVSGEVIDDGPQPPFGR